MNFDKGLMKKCCKFHQKIVETNIIFFKLVQKEIKNFPNRLCKTITISTNDSCKKNRFHHSVTKENMQWKEQG